MKFEEMAVSESKYLKASDLQGREVEVTIDHYTQDELENRKGEKEKKWVIWFRGKEKGLVLNVTNAETLGKLFPDSEAAIGKPIMLFAVQTSMGEGIRVRGNAPLPEDDIPF